MKKELTKLSIILNVILVAVLLYVYFLAGFNNTANIQQGVLNINTFLYRYFWIFGGVLLLLLNAECLYSFICLKTGKHSLFIKFCDKKIRYSYLLKQLVIRDFKTKYKRSFLGIFWSLLNPLLMMVVQYFIFSTLFGNDSIPNYPVYLLIGVIFFSFANEASSFGLSAITSNSTLITKVYVPKFIYPLSKVLSAAINFALTFIPLVIIMLVTGIWPSPAHIFIFIDLFLLFIFALGLAMFLSAVMVFFRDIQFLWGVFVMLWMYGTPIFYDMNFIKNEAVKVIIKCNPLYHYITFARTVLRDCACPDLSVFLYCACFSLISILIGGLTFKYTQDKFTLHI